MLDAVKPVFGRNDKKREEAREKERRKRAKY